MENFRRRLKNILLVVLLLLSSVVHKSSGLPMFAKDVLDTKAERQVSLFLLFRLSSFHYVFLPKTDLGSYFVLLLRVSLFLFANEAVFLISLSFILRLYHYKKK